MAHFHLMQAETGNQEAEWNLKTNKNFFSQKESYNRNKLINIIFTI